MKIELKNIKEAKFLSEETPAYSANLYVDGVKIGVVSNNGHGGCDSFYGDRKAYDAADRWLAENHEPYQGMTMDIELFCHLQLGRREDRQRLQKLIKKAVVALDPVKKEVNAYTWKGVSQVTKAHIEKFREKNPSLVILNDMADREAALDLFIAHT
jgi:hypothetical protein